MIVAFNSLSPAGGTFMDWSWHWLKGSDYFWNLKKGWIPLIDDPIKEKNAHGHRKNHPMGFEEWEKFLGSAKQESDATGKDISFYPGIRSTANNLNDYINHINSMIKQKVVVVVLKKTQEFPYGSARTDLLDDYNIFLESNSDLPSDISRKKLREMVSIRMVPQQKTWLEKIDLAFDLLDKEVVVVTDKEWTHQPEQTMIKICGRLGTVIDPGRLVSWRPIMHRWRENHKKTEFFYDHEIPLMADKIVAGEPMDLQPFNFKLTEESLLMMYVMKRHGRRLILPTNHFPKNTLDLHRFLK
tara:strand:- start:48 stop:944 length:897 start_codon:yes stop_codon:yes gene_type:complete